MNPTALAMLGFAAVVVAILVDGRHAIAVATVAVAIGLAPTVATVVGPPSSLIPLAAAGATVVLVAAARGAGRRIAWHAGLDPLVPAVRPAEHLFGPRSVRLAAAVAAAPAASWVSYNVPLGDVALVEGLLFAVAHAWLCGAARLLLARSVEDLAVAAAMVALAGAAAWLIRGGAEAEPEAACLAAIAPLSGLTAGWLAGRHAPRPKTRAAAEP